MGQFRSTSMMSNLRHMYEGLPYSFPVLKGCDDYIKRLDLMKLSCKKWTKTVLISADFSDAYTETGINRLQESVKLMGNLVGQPQYKTDLMVKLVKLVFTNCYFFTPYGLYRQTRGMPMGDVSSRYR